MIDCSKCIHSEVCANRYSNDGCEGICGFYLQDTRTQGEWYYNYQNGWHCSKCGKQVKEMPIDDNRKALYIFCPWCGEKLKHDTKQ